MKRILIVTGPLRSGTSMIAGMAHRMGFIAGTWINPPMPPKFRLEWEDKELFDLFYNPSEPTAKDFREYLLRRFFHADAIRRATGVEVPGITVKSPMLAWKWDEFMKAVEFMKLVKHIEVVIVKCTRSWPTPDGNLEVYKGTDFERQMQIANERINNGLKHINGREHNYNYMLQYPQHCANCLADLLGVTNEADVKAAAETIQ